MAQGRALPSDYLPDTMALRDLIRRRQTWPLIELIQEIWPGLSWEAGFSPGPNAMHTQWPELAGLTAAAATELYGLAARAVGIPMAAGNIGATTSGPITVGMFAMGTLICTFWGTVLAVLLARYATRPARAYVWTTVALTVVSLAGPLGCAGAILALANAEPERCMQAFEGDALAQLALAGPHRRAAGRFPAGIKELTAERFGTSTVVRMG